MLTAEQQPKGATPEYATMGYRGCFTNISGKLVNFFNTNDFALAKGAVMGIQANWEENQRTLKPEGFAGIRTYHFDGTNCMAIFNEYRTDMVTDPHEQKSMNPWWPDREQRLWERKAVWAAL